MEFKEYQRLAELLKEAEKIVNAHNRPSGKTKPINKYHDLVRKHLSEAKNHLEEMMFIEHPKNEKANTKVFYGPEDSTRV